MSRKSTPEQFWARGRADGDCLLWTGRLSTKGYGVVGWHGRIEQAHRVAFRLAFGEIPDGTEIDHLCRMRSCIAPDHLEAVTHQVNVSRKPKIIRDRCMYGHPLTPDNVVGSRRRCKTCSRAAWHRNYKPHARTSWPKGRTGSHTSRNVGENNPNSKAWKARRATE